MNKNILGAAGLLTVGLVAGSAFAITGANAADSAPVNASTSTSTTATTTDDENRPDTFSTTSIKPGESLLTGDALAKTTQAALAKYPGATVIRAENDSDGAEYEVHLKLADGSVATVEFDSSFKITGDHEGFEGTWIGLGRQDAGGEDGEDPENQLLQVARDGGLAPTLHRLGPARTRLGAGRARNLSALLPRQLVAG